MDTINNTSSLPCMLFHPVDFVDDHAVLACSTARRESSALPGDVPVGERGDAKTSENNLLGERVVVWVGSVEVQRTFQGDWRIRDEAGDAQVVNSSRMRHERMEDDDVATLASELDKLLALVDVADPVGSSFVPSSAIGPFGVVIQVFDNVGDTVRRNICSSSAGDDIVE